MVDGVGKSRWFHRLPIRVPAFRTPSHTRICREGWYYLGVLAFALCAAMLRQVNLLLILAGMLVGPVLFNWRLAITTLRGLRVRRKLPRGLCAGDWLVVALELENPRKRLGCWAVAVEDRICREGNSQTPLRSAVLFGYVPARQGQNRVYRGRLVQRGRYRLGPLAISTRFPFGLIERSVTLEQHDTLLVYPRLGRLTRAWATRHHESFDAASRHELRESRISGDFYGVRPWRQGDSRRLIHWRSSLRHGSLVVRQFEERRSRDVSLLIDLWQPENPTAHDLENVELAVSFAATVVTDLCRKGGGNLLLGITAAEPVCLAGPAAMVLLDDAMEALAVAEASALDRLPALVARAGSRLPSESDVILVSPRPLDQDAGHFASLGRDSSGRQLLQHLRIINTASEKLAEVFHVE